MAVARLSRSAAEYPSEHSVCKQWGGIQRRNGRGDPLRKEPRFQAIERALTFPN
jgi:hypothetical protein